MEATINKVIQYLEAGLDKKDVAYFHVGVPYDLSEAELLRGCITVAPVNESVISVTTGITDEETKTIAVTLAKVMKNDFYANAKKESGVQYLMRVIESREEQNVLKTNTIRYILRNNMRNLGLLQSGFDIAYDTNAVPNLGAATATITFTVTDHNYQILD